MPEGDEHCHSQLLYPIYVLAVLPKKHRLARRSVLDVADLRDEPILSLGRGFASRDWFLAACQVERIKPRVLFDCTVPQTLIALSAAGYGIAIVPGGVVISRQDVRAIPLVRRGVPIGRWQVIAWNPERFQAPYAERFVKELVAYTRRQYPNRDVTRLAPPLPRPKGDRSRPEHSSQGGCQRLSHGQG
jgi:DNA-binding transcriptional LysR family regulator